MYRNRYGGIPRCMQRYKTNASSHLCMIWPIESNSFLYLLPSVQVWGKKEQSGSHSLSFQPLRCFLPCPKQSQCLYKGCRDQILLTTVVHNKLNHLILNLAVVSQDRGTSWVRKRARHQYKVRIRFSGILHIDYIHRTGHWLIE